MLQSTVKLSFNRLSSQESEMFIKSPEFHGAPCNNTVAGGSQRCLGRVSLICRYMPDITCWVWCGAGKPGDVRGEDTPC